MTLDLAQTPKENQAEGQHSWKFLPVSQKILSHRENI